MKYTVTVVTTTRRNVTPAQTQLQLSRYKQEKSSEHWHGMGQVQLPEWYGFHWMIGSEGIYIIHPSLDWQVCGVSVGESLYSEHQSWRFCSNFWRWNYHPSLRVWQWDRHTERHSSISQGPRPSSCGGRSRDYPLGSARSLYWGSCRATISPRFQIKYQVCQNYRIPPCSKLIFPVWRSQMFF